MTSAQTSGLPQGDPEVVKAVGQGRRGRRLSKLLFVLILAAVVGGVAFWKLRSPAAQTVSYQTQKAERGDLRVTVTATGTLKARNTVEVGAEITGRVLAVNVNFNDLVKEGQILAEIDTEQARARIDEASAQLASASASLINARATAQEAKLKLERVKSMYEQQLTALQDLETADATYKRATASVQSASSQVTLAQASLTVAKTNLSKAVIKSPINGVVLNRAVEPGQTVTSGLQTPVLFVLAADLSQLQLNVQIDEADVGTVHEEQTATFTVDAYPLQTFQSKVIAVKNMPTAGQTVVTYEAWLTVDNSKRLLRPGMTATSTIVVDERKDVLLVPNAALRFKPPSANPAQQQGVSFNQLMPGGGRNRMPGQGRPAGAGSARAGTGRGPGTGAGDGGEPGVSRGGVWRLENGQPVRVRVETGATDGVRTEIKSGELPEGTEVVVSALDAKSSG